MPRILAFWLDLPSLLFLKARSSSITNYELDFTIFIFTIGNLNVKQQTRKYCVTSKTDARPQNRLQQNQVCLRLKETVRYLALVLAGTETNGIYGGQLALEIATTDGIK
jgi:hypothetical protein